MTRIDPYKTAPADEWEVLGPNEWAARTSIVRLTGDTVRGEGCMMTEPSPGSIVMTQGTWGTAWQRHFSDSLWHSTRGGKPATWGWLCVQRNLFIAYDATTRED